MQVSVETTQGLERRMTVAVPAERVEKEVENRLKTLSRTAKLAGFRPGKVPIKVITSKYGPQVRQEVLDEVTQRSFQEAVIQEKLQLAGSPRFEAHPSETGKDFEFTAVFEVFPGVKLAPVDKLKIDKPVAEITEKDVDNMLQKMRMQRATWEVVERPAALDDQVMIDFKGTIDGKDFTGNEGKNIPLVIGSGHFIASFEEQLVGAKAGDDLTVMVTFPDDYHIKEVAGKPASFAIKVHTVSAPVLPDIDDEFIRSYGVKEGGMEALRREVMEGMTQEMKQVIKSKIKSQVMDQLYAANPLELPKSLLEREIINLMNQARSTLINQGVKPNDVQLERDMFEERAKRKATLGLLLSEIIKDNNFKAEAPQVRQEIENIASTYDDPQEVIKWYYADRSRLSSIESVVLEDRVVEWVLELASVTEIRYTFDDIMKNRQADQAYILP